MTNKTWRGRALAVGVGVGATAIVLAGCGAPGGGNETEAPEVVDTTVTVAQTNELTSLNSITPTGNLDVNGAVDYLTNDSFFYINPELEIIPNEGFGTMEKLSDDPLTVEYKINEGLTWSDGEPITANDLLLGWAANSGYYDDATLDAETGAVTTGTQYFQPAGGTTGLDKTAYPEIGEDGLSLTLTYSEAYADWDLTGLIGKPIHIVAEKAGTTVDDLVAAFEETPHGDAAAPAEPNATIKAAADFWNTGYDMTSFPDDPDLLVGNGPFILDSWEPTQSATFVLNENYGGTHNPAYSELVMRFIGDPNAQTTALQNGEVDVISPQANADLLTNLEAIDGIVIQKGDDLGWEHLDLRQSGVFADLSVREAFLKTIPRQQILDAIVKPLNPEAEVLNSFVYLASQPEYPDTLAQNGWEAYEDVDIEGAKELLAGATPTIRLMYNINNPNRVQEFKAIQASATQAGFNIVDGGAADWSDQLTQNTWDATIFGWGKTSDSPVQLVQSYQIGNGSNFGAFNNEEASELAVASQFTADPEVLKENTMRIDQISFEEGYGLPLFQNAAIIAQTDRITDLEFNALSYGELRNFWEWKVAE